MDVNLNRFKRFATTYTYQIAIFIFFLIVYVITRYPGVGGRMNFGDSAKWQYLHLANGLPHGTGYPQFLFLSEIFARLVFFLDLSERITFISIFFGALSLVVFYTLLFLLTKNKIGSVLSTLLVGFSYVFWTQATEAEVYTLNIFYLLSVFYLFIQFYLTKNEKYYLFGCAVYALSFGNHLSMVTILPAVGFICLITDYKTVIKPKNLALVAIFVFLGVLQYAFIYYRASHSDPRYMEIPFNPTFDQFFNYITGSDKSTMLAFTWKQIMDQRIPVLLSFVRVNFTYVGILLAFAGFFYFLYVRRSYVILGFLTLAMLGQVGFNISYNVNDLIVFFIPVYVLIGAFIGLVFAVKKDLIPKVCISLLVLFIFINNIYSKNIFLKDTYWLNHFKPVYTLYQNQKDNLPWYVSLNAGDYFHRNFLNYINLSGTIRPKSIAMDLQPELDSFYVSSFYPELATNYYYYPVEIESIEEYVKNINKPNRAVFFSSREVGSENMTPDFINYMKTFGSAVDKIPAGGKYVAVLYNGKLVEAIRDSGPAIIDSDSVNTDPSSMKNDPLEGGLSYVLYSGKGYASDSSGIGIKGYNYSVNRKGLNIVGYDLNTNQVMDMVSFDTFGKEDKRLFKVVKKQYALKSSRAPINKTVSLKNKSNLYLSSGNGTPTMGSNNAAGSAEKFLVVDAGDGKIALKNGDKYVSSENGLPMTCNRTSIGDWEKFNWVTNPDGTISLWGSSWRLVAIENGIGPVVCNKLNIGDWEKFTVELAQ